MTTPQEDVQDFGPLIQKYVSDTLTEWVDYLTPEHKLMVHDSADDGSWIEFCVRKNYQELAVFRVTFQVEKVK